MLSASPLRGGAVRLSRVRAWAYVGARDKVSRDAPHVATRSTSRPAHTHTPSCSPSPTCVRARAPTYTHTLMQVRTQAHRHAHTRLRLRTLALAYAPIRPQRASLAAMRRVRPTHTCARPRFSRVPTLSASTKKTTVGVGCGCRQHLHTRLQPRLLGAHE